MNSARITTHYLAGELLNLWEAANKVCEEQRKLTLTLLRTAQTTGDLARAKVAQGFLSTLSVLYKAKQSEDTQISTYDGHLL